MTTEPETIFTEWAEDSMFPNTIRSSNADAGLLAIVFGIKADVWGLNLHCGNIDLEPKTHFDSLQDAVDAANRIAAEWLADMEKQGEEMESDKAAVQSQIEAFLGGGPLSFRGGATGSNLVDAISKAWEEAGG